MITEKKVIEVLKQFEQHDYKRGGVSIDPSNYNAIAMTLVKNCSIPDVVVRSEQLCQHPFIKVINNNNGINYCSKCDKAI